MNKRHHFHSPYRRGLYSLMLVLFVVALGVVGIHYFEKFSYVDSFFFTSMIATGQGPVGDLTPQTVPGKIFTSFLAFISVGVLLAALGFLFGPFLGMLWRIGVVKLEEEFTSRGADKKDKGLDPPSK